MQWDASANARASPKGRRGCLCLRAQRRSTWQTQKNDPNSLFAWYQSLIRLKKTVPAFESGANIMLDTENNKVLSWMRQAHGAAQVVVSVNFTADAADGESGPWRRGSRVPAPEDTSEDAGRG